MLIPVSTKKKRYLYKMRNILRLNNKERHYSCLSFCQLVTISYGNVTLFSLTLDKLIAVVQL